MSQSHLELLKLKLEASKWKLLTEYNLQTPTDYWFIARPNGDCITKLTFTIGGNGTFGAILGNETICNAIACTIEEHPSISIYFGKYNKQFQLDINQFIKQLNTLDKKSL